MSTDRHYEALDGLRGIAALCVVALHVGNYFEVPVAPTHGYLAVDFFFMLSGFVIAHAYDKRLRNGLGALAFLKLRVVRLYPLILLGILMGSAAWLARILVLGDVGLGSVLAAAAMNAVLLPTSALAYVTPWAFPINSPLWSLLAEILANILYAVAGGLATTRRVAVVAAVGAAPLMLLAWGHGSLDVGFAWGDLPLGVARVFYPFFTGVVLLRISRGQRTKSAWGYGAAILLCAVLAAPVGSSALYDAVSVLLIFPLTIVMAARASSIAFLDAISHRLGAWSYPLYVTHFPCVVVLSNLAHRRGLTGIRLDVAALLCFLAVLVFAAAIASPYDASARFVLRRLLTRKPIGIVH